MAQATTTQAQTSRTAASAARAPAGRSIDIATILGVIGAFTMIIVAMTVSGSPDAFIDVPSILIVVGGSFLVTTISYSLGEIWRAQGVMLRAVIYHSEQPEVAALRVLSLADEARRHGIFTLQNHLSSLRHNRFLQQALIMVVDGAPTEEIDRVLSQELMATADRHQRSAGVLRRAGEVAPAMGLIGTLVGLVQMLGNLDDPSSIGPAMAIALLTTFYGAVMANMVFLPVANKLDRNSQLEAMVNQIYVLGAASISRQENPRRLELMLNTVLPPAKRVSFFD